MAVNPKIKEKAEKIRKEVYGKDVREALASGLEVMSEDVEETKQRQDNVESLFQSGEYQRELLTNLNIPILKNLVENGNFQTDSNDDGLADGWLAGDEVTNFRIENNAQYWTSSSSAYSGGIRTSPYLASQANHKYYIAFEFENVRQVAWSGTTDSILQHNVYLYDGFFSRVITADDRDTYTRLVFYVEEPNVESYIRNVIFVDLTETFGAGNEPSQEEIDEILENVGYFTTKALFNGSKLQEKIATVETKQNYVQKAILNDVIQISNKVPNGNFSVDSNNDGLADGWRVGSAVTNFRIENNRQYWTAPTEKQYNGGLIITGINSIPNRKYYISFEQKNVGRFYWATDLTAFQRGILVDGKVSFIMESSDTYDRLYFYNRTANVESYLKDVIVIDLTETFGAGNEPDVEKMDNILHVIKDKIFSDNAYLFNVNKLNDRVTKIENAYSYNPNRDLVLSLKNLEWVASCENASEWTVDGGNLQTVTEIDKSVFPPDYVYAYTGYNSRWGRTMLKYDVTVPSVIHRPIDSVSIDLMRDTIALLVFVEDLGLSEAGIKESIEVRLYSDYPYMDNNYFLVNFQSYQIIPGTWEYLTRSIGLTAVGSPDPNNINGVSIHVTPVADKRFTIYLGGLYKFRRQLNKGIIMLDFDDSLKTFYTKAFDYMTLKKGYRGSVSVIGGRVEENIPGTMTIDEHLTMQDAGWDMMNHLYGMYNLIGDEESIVNLIETNDKWMRDNGLIPVGLVPPGNRVNRLTRDILKRYYKISRGRGESATPIPIPDLLDIGSTEINEGLDLNVWRSRLQTIQDYKVLRNFHFHEIGDSGYGYTTFEKFKQLIDAIEDYDIEVMTYSDILNGKWM